MSIDPDVLAERLAALEAAVDQLRPTPSPQANPPITIGPFTNVPAPGSPIRSDWTQQITHRMVDQLEPDIQASVSSAGTSTTGPYVGGWGPAGQRMKLRSGHVSVATSGFGDATITFPSTFPSGVIAVLITPVQTANDVFWWPVVRSVALGSCGFWAVTVQGSPAATGHPPGLTNVWTVVGNIVLDYYALGV